jgi:hypothetical protein
MDTEPRYADDDADDDVDRATPRSWQWLAGQLIDRARGEARSYCRPLATGECDSAAWASAVADTLTQLEAALSAVALHSGVTADPSLQALTRRLRTSRAALPLVADRVAGLRYEAMQAEIGPLIPSVASCLVKTPPPAADGAQGPPGPRGSWWFTGAGPPRDDDPALAAAQGGDLYLQVDDSAGNGDVFQLQPSQPPPAEH